MQFKVTPAGGRQAGRVLPLRATACKENGLKSAVRYAIEQLEARTLLTSVTLHPSDDAYIRDGTYADTAEGNANAGQVQVKTISVSSYDRDGYMKFAVSIPSGNLLSSAALRVYGQTVVGSTYSGPTINNITLSAFPAGRSQQRLERIDDHLEQRARP